jgi:chorismate mutase/prephenate dehydratase
MSLDSLLVPFRQEIDALDTQLIALLKKRALIAEQVGKIKRENKVYFHRADRQAIVFEKVGAHGDEVLSKRALESIYAEIIAACLAKEIGLQVACLGPKGTYSEEASLAQFGTSAQLMLCDSIDEVVQAVQTQRSHTAMVPIENSTEGVVTRTLDLLLTSEVLIQGEISLPIRHQFLSTHTRLEDISTVYAHPQALAQCTKWLQKYLPKAQLCATASTAAAAQLASSPENANQGIAAIASERAGVEYGLGWLARNIQDESNNRTRFAELGYFKPAATGNDQTSIILSTHNRSGSLHHLLEPFTKNNVSITRFESRPVKNSTWDYYFYVDFPGHCSSPNIKALLADLEKTATFYKWLGSYPIRVLN